MDNLVGWLAFLVFVAWGMAVWFGLARGWSRGPGRTVGHGALLAPWTAVTLVLVLIRSAARRMGIDVPDAVRDVAVEHARYYVGQRLAGQRVAVAVAAADRALVVRHRGAVLKQLPLRGLHGAREPFERYLALMEREARAEARRGRGRLTRLAA